MWRNKMSRMSRRRRRSRRSRMSRMSKTNKMSRRSRTKNLHRSVAAKNGFAFKNWTQQLRRAALQ